MLFTNAEFAAYLQQAEDALLTPTVVLLRSLIEAEIDDILAGISTSPSAEVRLKGIALEAVARHYRNPEALTTQTIGAISHGRDSVTSGVYLLDTEVSRIRDIVGTGGTRRSIPLQGTLAIRSYPR